MVISSQFWLSLDRSIGGWGIMWIKTLKTKLYPQINTSTRTIHNCRKLHFLERLLSEVLHRRARAFDIGTELGWKDYVTCWKICQCEMEECQPLDVRSVMSCSLQDGHLWMLFLAPSFVNYVFEKFGLMLRVIHLLRVIYLQFHCCFMSILDFVKHTFIFNLWFI